MKYDSGEGRFALVKLDNVDVPELLMINERDEMLVYAIEDGKVVNKYIYNGWTDLSRFFIKSFRYCEKSGNIVEISPEEEGTIWCRWYIYDGENVYLKKSIGVTDGDPVTVDYPDFESPYDMLEYSREHRRSITEEEGMQMKNELLEKVGERKYLTADDIHKINADEIAKVLG